MMILIVSHSLSLLTGFALCFLFIEISKSEVKIENKKLKKPHKIKDKCKKGCGRDVSWMYTEEGICNSCYDRINYS